MAVGLLLGLAVLIPRGLQAQQTTGTILGTVIDPSKALVPGATVEVRNVATQVMRSIQTDSTGSFEAVGLQPGIYQVTVRLAGFETNVVENVSLAFGARLRLEVALTIGQETTSISVEATTNAIETDAARINQTLVTKKVLDLPYNSIGTLNLGRFMPGTYAGSGAFEWSGSGTGNTDSKFFL